MSGETHYRQGITFGKQARFDEAAASFQAAIAAEPGNLSYYHAHAAALSEVGRDAEAIATLDAALTVDPRDRLAHIEKAYLLLANGDFLDGWPAFEWRWDSALPKMFGGKPLWLGQPVEGKTVLLHWEQGLGDIIQFSRYCKPVADLGARVILQVPRSLMRLMKELPGVDQLVAADDVVTAFDFRNYLGSLPLVFGSDNDTIPTHIPYLHAEPERVAHWQQRLGAEGFKIGICWQGGVTPVDALGRSFPLAQFSALSDISGVRLISLHKGSGETQLQAMPSGLQVETLGADFDAGDGAFTDSAAVMTCCDLVITSDTAIAHLAGALGVPVWIALRKYPDWRWQKDRSDTPWYPTARLFRQSVARDWDGVFTQIRAALQEHL